ncbi:MAG: DUF4446 family protein [Candidatus Doudnabacteria bacterium]|nr:DUF4446 family protein [Candidatus Doudnabacteria bacterium]
MNIAPLTISLILSILALLLGGFVWWQNRSLNELKKNFFAGQKAANLEDVILELRERLEIAVAHQQQLEQNLKQLELESGFMIQKTGLIRFNPFKDGGGNFSFCLALLDKHDNGVVITSMYGREQNRIYTKNVREGRGDAQLNEEEQKAIALANSKT